MVSRSVCPCARARSISAARFLAVTEASPAALGASFAVAGLATATFLTEMRLAGVGAAPLPAGFAATVAATVLRADINLVPLLDQCVLTQLELAVRDAFTGLDIVLVAMPGAHEMQFGVRKIQALRGLVGHDAFFHLGDRQPLAGRSPLVQAVVAIRIESAMFPEYADFLVADEHDTTVAVLELRNLADKFLSHSKRFLPAGRGGRFDFPARPLRGQSAAMRDSFVYYDPDRSTGPKPPSGA